MEIKNPNAFTIKRSSWLKGSGKETCILDYNGKRDCFGFLFQSANVPDAELLKALEPGDIARRHNWSANKLIEYGTVGFYQTSLCNSIIKTNDANDIDEEIRESFLIELFASIGITLSFID